VYSTLNIVLGKPTIKTVAFPVDSIGSCVFAYGLDQLASNAGYSCRVRRSTDNVEMDFGFNMAAVNTFIGGGTGYFPKLYNQATGVDAIQVAAASQPSLTGTEISGVNTQYLTSTQAAGTAGDFAVSFWMKSNASIITRTTAYALGASGAGSIIWDYNDGSGLLLYYNSTGPYNISSGAVGAYTNLSWNHFIVQRNGATMELYVNGILAGTNTTATAFTTGAVSSLFSDNSGLGGFSGQLAQVMFFSKALTANNRTTLTTYLPRRII
jgi:hypothetical protein